jgi:hypothetical protein
MKVRVNQESRDVAYPNIVTYKRKIVNILISSMLRAADRYVYNYRSIVYLIYLAVAAQLRQQEAPITTPYAYHPLPSPGQIRLLVLEPIDQSPDASIHVSVLNHSIEEAPLYEALSYCWGDVSKMAQITTDGKSMLVTPNLCAALMYLRQNSTPRTLWVDAVCIYSYRTVMKRLGNLRFIPQFSEGFHFISERKNSCSMLSRCTLHIPDLLGSHLRVGGAPGEHARALGEPHGALP